MAVGADGGRQQPAVWLGEEQIGFGCKRKLLTVLIGLLPFRCGIVYWAPVDSLYRQEPLGFW